MTPEILKKKNILVLLLMFGVQELYYIIYYVENYLLKLKMKKNLMQIISNGYIDFLNFISNNAKDLIKKMLCVNPLYRFSSNDILKHQWLFNVLDLFS